MKLARLAVVSITSAIAISTLAPTTAGGSSCWDFKGAERTMAKKVNNARGSHGLVKLKLDPEMSKIARSHSKTMAKKASLYHTKNLGSKVTNWKSLGENVGYGSTVKQLHNLFMGSSGHRDNILKASYRHVGVGSTRKDGTLWITVIFESKKNPGTSLNMPNC
jgi:uncharacterized protein YkwD